MEILKTHTRGKLETLEKNYVAEGLWMIKLRDGILNGLARFIPLGIKELSL